MYAIFADGGRQYKVEEGQQICIDYRDGIGAGEELTFDRVLAACGDAGSLTLGHPIIDGATVTATVIGPVKGKKLVVQKIRRRKNSRRKTGHRSIYTRIQINKIGV
ncbi:MAG: 50S ribosomal protein L21 [Pirellulales bacterium]|nr:50S ribosomal protein L21 [Pirellulales bacterium]